eukprot:CAMPEP_0116075852 /NCGR_PEP_ID=MMETSP0322-20121206/16881_1 /TAXON_ID=163516 /ORGANISM="Leptocylindrus danicus var. apora, Strain B651" /LENGTH=660 /DNA_ID=CAMNT_0003565989 /DNA_START=58 /DNA_END=2037 /DNA_ORIENTATION=+
MEDGSNVDSLLQSLLSTGMPPHPHPNDDSGGEDDALLQESLANLETALNQMSMELNEPAFEPELSSSLLPPGLVSSSATAASGESVVPKNASAPMSAVAVEDHTKDAWALSLANFGTLEEFLAADAANKEQQKQGVEHTVVEDKGLMENAILYDENEDVATFVQDNVSSLPSEPKVMQESKISPPPAVSASGNMPPRYPPPSDVVMPAGVPASPMRFPPGVAPQGASAGPPPPHFVHPPPHVSPMPIPHGMAPPYPIAPGQPSLVNLPQFPMNMGMPMMHQTKQPEPPPKPKFHVDEFPRLGSDKSNSSKNDASPALAKESSNDVEGKKSTRPKSILFNNPAAVPISTRLATSSLMTQRDVQFVITAMLRPLTAENHDDFYYKQYLHKFNIYKDKTDVDLEKRNKFRENIEARSKEWQEKKQSLGRIVKTDVTRPRALLAAPKLTKSAQDEISVETKLRVSLWKARAQIDAGYRSYFELIDLSAKRYQNEVSENDNERIRKDIRSNLIKLNACFGIGSSMSGVVDQEVLSCTLSLPKGKELLAKAMEKGILPHPSAMAILPFALAMILSKPCSLDANDSAVQKEIRLLRSFLMLINLPNPSIQPDILVSCLEEVVSIQSNTSIRELLNARQRLEVMHAVLTRGSQLCANNENFQKQESMF